MAKIEALNDVANLESQTTAVQVINENSDKITTALTNTLSRDGSSPNAMGANLDLGSYRIINLAAAVDDNDAVRKAEFDVATGGLTTEVVAAVTAVPAQAAAAAASAAAAAVSAADAASYIGAAVSASKWSTGRTITLTGDATGVSGIWDGSGNISFAITIPALTITNAKMAVGAAVANIGYTPANLAGATFTGDVRLSATPATLYSDSAGFRGAPVTIKDANYTFVMNDSGYMFNHTSATGHSWTLPSNASVPYPTGTIIVLRNNGSGIVTLPQTGSVTIRLPGTSGSGTKYLGQYGFATLVKESTDEWIISGSGVT